MKILVTGGAGFIGFHIIQALLSRGDEVTNIDNINSYYSIKLKNDRLEQLESNQNKGRYKFIKIDLADRRAVSELFEKNNFEVVVNLAAQAGVRYSITNPHEYVDSNLVGFVNILEGCRNTKIRHLIYASSSSVYGMNIKQPYETTDRVDNPISLYAATKRANELMAYTYSHLYGVPTTGLRFFTVYGPWGRPDMAYYKFTKNILAGKFIDVFNEGKMQRDFTYIDDIVTGMLLVIDRVPGPIASGITRSEAPYKIYNIGNNQPVTIRRFITAIERATGKKAKETLMPMQAGDVYATFANIDDLLLDTGFRPSTIIEDGIEKFVKWFIDYNKRCSI